MRFFKWLGEQLFPDNFTCGLCGKEIFNGGRFCAECAKTVQFNDWETCPVCGRKTATSSLCLECKALAPKYKKAASAIVYEDGGANLIYKFKNGNAYLKDYFADLLQDKCAEFADADGICFVPMLAKDERNRGYNQAELLARAISERLKIPVLKNALKKVKKTAQQKSLTKSERENNLKGCFKADGKVVKGKTLILVDDVMTTGATAEEICNELLKRGAKAIYFVTAASVEYKVNDKTNDKLRRRIKISKT